jgi:hypothetical protein
MAVHSDVGWKTCARKKCVGVQLPSGRRCWAHADAHDLDAALDLLRQGVPLDGRGVVFTAGLLERVLDAISDDNGRAVVKGGDFKGATFTGDAHFDGATFERDATFLDATFERDADFHGATFAGYANFSGVTFAGYANFAEATFGRGANFGTATFAGYAGFAQATFGRGPAYFFGAIFRRVDFAGATFAGLADFRTATFGGTRLHFEDTTFAGPADFALAKFERGRADFRRATFAGRADFASAKFGRDARFGGATFAGDGEFSGATFERDGEFGRATFERDADFHGATIAGDGEFSGATFQRAQQLGPMLVRTRLTLDGALFHERIQVDVGAAELSCTRARFLAGVQLRVCWAQVVLDDADVAAPSTLSGAKPFDESNRGDESRLPESPWPVDHDDTLRLLSVRGADVAGLTVAGVDMQACRFRDAHHLDQLRAEGSKFANTPRRRRWTKRRTIAEEHQWRASEGKRGWYGPANQPPDWLELKALTPGQGGLLPPGEIAALYRDLRKGLEDSKDEPGAADFYYGEMEMRRHDKRQQIQPERTLRIRNGESAATTRDGNSSTNPGSSTETPATLNPGRFDSSAAAEYAILTLYWLVSGYGLRAWRALTSLTAVVLVASVIFAFWGFAGAAGWGDLRPALIYSVQATTALLRGLDARRLTELGEWTQIALRLIGPVLLGLAVLSVRGRVKR